MKRTLWISLLALVMGTNVGCETLLRRMVCRHDWGPYPGYICGHWNGGYRGRSPHLTNSWCRGCGEKYYHDGWTPWPDCHEPCDYCGNFTGASYPGRSGGGPGSGYGCADPGMLRPEPVVDGSGYMPTWAGGGGYAGEPDSGGEMMADGTSPNTDSSLAEMPGRMIRGNAMRSNDMPGGPDLGYSAADFYPPEPGGAFTAQGYPTNARRGRGLWSWGGPPSGRSGAAPTQGNAYAGGPMWNPSGNGPPAGSARGMSYGPYAPPRNPNQGGLWQQLFAGYPQQQPMSGSRAMSRDSSAPNLGPAGDWSPMAPTGRESTLAYGGRGRPMYPARSLPAEVAPEATAPQIASRTRRTRETRPPGLPEFREQIVDDEYARTIPPEGVEVYRSPPVWKELGPANSPEARMATRPERPQSEPARESGTTGGTRRSSYEWAPQRTKVSRASRASAERPSEYTTRRSTRPAARLRTVE